MPTEEPDLILKAIRVELDLTTEQARWCERAAGVSRVAYNWGLGEWRKWYRWSSIDRRAKRLGAFWARFPAEPGDKKPRLNDLAGEALARSARRKWKCSLSIRAVRLCRLWNGYAAAKANDDKPALKVISDRVRVLVDKVTERHPYSIGPSAFGIHARLTPLKKAQFKWMHEIGNSYVARDAIQVSLSGAYEAFFRRVKKHAAGDHSECGISKFGRCQLGEPRRRRKDPSNCSFINDQGSALATRSELVKITGQRGGDKKRRVRQQWQSAVRLPGIGWIEACRGQKLPVGAFDNKHKLWVGDPGVKLCGVGIRKWAGKWYASVRLWVPRPKVKEKVAGSKIAVETGVRYLAVTFDGTKLGTVGGTRDVSGLASLERRRKLWERRMARRWQPGKNKYEQSRGWCEARDEVAKYHRVETEVRSTMLHRTSRRIVDQNAETVVIRDMGVKTMLARGAKLSSTSEQRKRNVLAPLVARAGMGEFARQLTYKQEWAKGEVLVESRDTPSTRTCNACGHVQTEEPGYPWFRCSECSNVEDRDVNAVRNRYDYRPPSGESVGGAGPRRRNTAGKPAATAERTGKRGDEDDSSSVRPDVSESSASSATAHLGAGNGAAAEAPASADEKGRRSKGRRTQPGPSGSPEGHPRIRRTTSETSADDSEHSSDGELGDHGSQPNPEGGRSARARRSQSGTEPSESTTS